MVRTRLHYWLDKNNIRHATISIPSRWWERMADQELATATGSTWEEAKRNTLSEAQMFLDNPIPPDETIEIGGKRS